jgi:hypothetical protein
VNDATCLPPFRFSPHVPLVSHLVGRCSTSRSRRWACWPGASASPSSPCASARSNATVPSSARQPSGSHPQTSYTLLHRNVESEEHAHGGFSFRLIATAVCTPSVSKYKMF